MQGHAVAHRHASLAGGTDGRGEGDAGCQPSLYSFLIVGLSQDVKYHLAIVPGARQHILAISFHTLLVHQRDECPCVLRVVEVKPLRGTDDGTRGGIRIFLLKQCLIAHVNSKRMGGRHLLAEVGKVFHRVVAADGIIQQQAVVGKVVFVHKSNINDMVSSSIDGK